MEPANIPGLEAVVRLAVEKFRKGRASGCEIRSKSCTLECVCRDCFSNMYLHGRAYCGQVRNCELLQWVYVVVKGPASALHTRLMLSRFDSLGLALGLENRVLKVVSVGTGPSMDLVGAMLWGQQSATFKSTWDELVLTGIELDNEWRPVASDCVTTFADHQAGHPTGRYCHILSDVGPGVLAEADIIILSWVLSAALRDGSLLPTVLEDVTAVAKRRALLVITDRIQEGLIAGVVNYLQREPKLVAVTRSYSDTNSHHYLYDQDVRDDFSPWDGYRSFGILATVR